MSSHHIEEQTSVIGANSIVPKEDCRAFCTVLADVDQLVTEAVHALGLRQAYLADDAIIATRQNRQR